MKPNQNPFRQTLDQRNNKFDPEKALKKIKEESATPWSTLRNGRHKNRIYLETNQAGKNQLNKIHKKNLNKYLLEEKRKEPTLWEDFKSDPNDEIKKRKKNKQLKIKAIHKKYADKELDVKNLTAGESNYIRSKITRATFQEKGTYSSLDAQLYAIKKHNIINKNKHQKSV